MAANICIQIKCKTINFLLIETMNRLKTLHRQNRMRVCRHLINKRYRFRRSYNYVCIFIICCVVIYECNFFFQPIQIICNVCSKCFATKSSLTRHLKKHSAAVKKFLCPICRNPCDNKSNLKAHHQRKHKNMIQPNEVIEVIMYENGYIGST